MLKLLSLFILIFSLSVSAHEKEVEALSTAIIEKLQDKQKSKIAVVDFTNLDGQVTKLGRFIAEELSVSLAGKSTSIVVIDRIHLKAIIKEHKLSETGLIDPVTSRKLGKIAGIDALITGSLTPFGDNIRTTVKILNVETAQIIGAEAVHIPKTKAIEHLVNNQLSNASSKHNNKKTNSVTEGSPKKSYQQTKSAGSLIVNLKKCTKKSSLIKCDFIIESMKNHYSQKIYSKSRIFDDNGNEILASNVAFGNKSSRGYVKITLLKGTPVKASLEFNNVPNETRYIKNLEIRFYRLSISLKDISFSN
ncbi:FlgO family outer membrane protein [Aliikangiella sp. IMCC44359]|uniref:FlgO family outer membrane protein n=1 Tax=Aliikangiella sp. IMCC44359 TaxID=3459125 RepID=UPI00403AEA53